MAWKDISSTVVNYKDSYSSIPSGATAVCLQYDDDEKTPEKIKVRFKYYRIDGKSNNFYDSMYILYNANDSESSVGNLGRTLFLLKAYTGKTTNISWPFYSESFTIKKNFDTDHFTLQDFWICNNGNTAVIPSASNFYNNYRFNRGEGKAGSFACFVDSDTFTISGTAATEVSKGSISITDHYNNTFSVSGTKGTAGENNPSSGPTITWGYSTTYENSGAASKKALAIKTTSDATRTIYAKCVTGATYGSDATVTTSKAIKQYVAPGDPGVPVLSSTVGKTFKEPWIFDWTAAKAANKSSPVVGYRIRLIRNGTAVLGLKVGTGNIIAYDASNTNNFVDREDTSCQVIFNLADFGFVAGDQVKVMVHAYTRYGASNTGSQLFNNNGKTSAAYGIKKAGILHVNVKDVWKEGQVYVKANNEWREAESVSVNVNGSWKESV